MASQLPLLPDITTKFPSTRYQGSKAKLADWIWAQIAEFDFDSCLDVFGGTGAVAYRLKQAGKRVTYNDLLKFNYHIGQALIENSKTVLDIRDIDFLLRPQPGINYPTFIHDTFADIYFTDEENLWLDQTITNIYHLTNPYQFALAFFALCQSCIIKRPYNLFHRKNLYVRFADVDRTFGNKTSWDKPFEYWFRAFVAEVNEAVFANGCENRALNYDVIDVPGDYDLVYIDPPYISKRGTAVDYLGFYHFLEGLTAYDEWHTQLDEQSKHRRLKSRPSRWTNKNQIYMAFNDVFERYENSILVVSYRADGIPTISELTHMLKRFKTIVEVRNFGQYKYALSTNARSAEILLIGR